MMRDASCREELREREKKLGEDFEFKWVRMTGGATAD